MSLVAVVAATACVASVVIIELHWLFVQEVPDDNGVIVGAANYLEFVELQAEYTTCVLLMLKKKFSINVESEL